MSILKLPASVRSAARFVVAAVFLATLMHDSAINAEPLEYPASRAVDTVDEFHGVKVADPYRWLEDLESEEVSQWVAAQNRLTFGCLESIDGRQRLSERIRELIDYERVSLPARRGSKYFFSRNSGQQNHYVKYWSESLGGEERVLLDPNNWSEDGTTALAGSRVSDDGKMLLFGVSVHGSDWVEWRVMEIETGRKLDDRVQWSKGGADWDKGARGFYYKRLPEPEDGDEFTVKSADLAIWHHRLGTDQSEDKLVFNLPEHPDWYISMGVSEDRDLGVIYVSPPADRENRLWFKNLLDPQAPVEKIFNANDARYWFVASSGRKLLVQTTKDAPNWRLIEVDMDRPEPEHWRDVLPEKKMALNDVKTVGGYIFATYLKDAHDVVYQYTLDGGFVREIKFPGPVSVGGFGGLKGDTETFYSYNGFTTPSAQYRLDLETGESTLLRRTELDVDVSAFTARQFFYRADDGTAIPIFVMHKKGIELDGNNPAILYAYGGFNSAQRPSFSTTRLAWLEAGGIYAIACIRGGGEYGEAWHRAATKNNKRVSVDDFISGAEWMIDQGYCTADTLACCGWSNGGFLIGAVVNKRPDLFKVALPGTGVMDLLRFNLFGWGAGWEADYGSPQNPDEFSSIYAISPYHNIRQGVDYPSTLILTSDTDDRVMPGHSFKYAARLQAAQADAVSPILLRIEVRAGHGGGVPLYKHLNWYADQYAFALHEMGFEIP